MFVTSATTTTLAILLPHLAFIPIAALLLAAIIGNHMRSVPVREWVTPSRLSLAAIALGLLAVASALWAPAGSGAIGKGLLLIGLALALEVVLRSIARASPEEREAWSRGLIAAFLLGGLFVAVETLSERSLMRFFYNVFPPADLSTMKSTKNLTVADGRITFVDDADLNRRTTVLMLLASPTILALSTLSPSRIRSIAALAVAVITASIVIFTTHQSTQLAAAAALVSALLAWLSLRFTRSMLIAAWIAALVLAVPIAAQLYKSGVQNSTALFSTAQQRIIIWGYTAEQVGKRPLLGIGAGATSVLHSARPLHERQMTEDMIYPYSSGWHTHSYYLQIWYELGGAGAVLLLCLGVLMALATRYLVPAVQNFALTEFALVAGIIATSYGLWQFWLHGAIASAIAAIALINAQLARR